MRIKYKLLLTIITILLILCAIIGLFSIFKPASKPSEPQNVTIINDIENFNYKLEDRDTQYMKEEFNNLVEVLKSTEVDYEEYAKILSKLFIIDFYTLNNKINKYDVGSVEYINSDAQENFKSKAIDTIYKDIIDNTYKDRRQELPEVTNVEIIDLTKTSMEYNKEKKEVYKVTVKITYYKDLGYDDEGTIYLMLNGDKLEIIKYEPQIEKE